MIRVENLHKVYRSHGGEHVVLRDTSFTVPRGFRLGILGRNGAGKSTLIRLIGKVEQPTRGRVSHEMSVSWPLGFSGSFQGSLTGIDNMRFIARIYRTDFEQLRAFVEEFAELGSFLYQPVKTYSSGMRARLAFALSIAIDFDCYLIDEVMMVGDERFHQRSRGHLFAPDSGRALVVASHDASFIEQVCDGALVISRGRTRYFDDVAEAIKTYKAL
ncbi:MAG: ATP-binding cassette domain-containing protein [Stagnimonas sp.]|nr:ATP-binding cassette domain-containing protein [Stagnimonas sp.]